MIAVFTPATPAPAETPFTFSAPLPVWGAAAVMWIPAVLLLVAMRGPTLAGDAGELPIAWASARRR